MILYDLKYILTIIIYWHNISIIYNQIKQKGGNTMKMKYTQQDKKDALSYIMQFKGKEVAACVKSVSKSGMSRRIELYADGYNRIGYYIAVLLDYPYDADKGLKVDGCGMDMVFHTLSNFNYFMAQKITGKTLQELMATKECGERIYDHYFFDADRYRTL